VASGILAILQFGLLTFLAAVVATVLVTVAGQIYAGVIRHAGREQELREKIVRYSRLVTGLQDRVERRKQDAAGAASQLFGAQRLEKQLRLRLRELEKEPHRFVRIIGQELAPNRPFEILATNSSVAHQVKRGERHPFYDSGWARTCQVHVWAKTAEDAKAEFERVFPRSVGFKLLSLEPMTVESTSAVPGETTVAEPAEAPALERPAEAALP